MRTATILTGVTAFASTVAGHATWQQLWVNGKDLESTCARLPPSNNPLQDPTSNDMRCNANSAKAASNCAVKAGDTVTIEMHQHNSRGCTEEAIGGAHYGPVLAYMSAVKDAASADGSDPFFKVYESTWAKSPSASQGSDDFWGTKDLNKNCGKMDFKVPADLAPGDYLLRAEAIALHSAASVGGAQYYMTCYQLTVTGSGTAVPKGAVFPGAYKAADPGLEINIYAPMTSYAAPGPALIEGGTEATAGSSPGGAGAAGGAAPVASGSASAPAPKPTSAAATPSKEAATTMKTSVIPSSAAASASAPASAPVSASASASATATTASAPAPSKTAGSGSGECAAKYAQCGGNNFTGAACCTEGTTCKVQNPYYSQCV